MENKNTETDQELLPKPLTDLPKADMDLPLPEKEIPANITDNPKKHSRIPKIALLLISFVLLLALMEGGFYLYKNSNNNSVPVPPADPDIYKGPSPTPDPTADWETFEMPSYSIKAPPEFRRDMNAGNLNTFLSITNYDVVSAPGREFSPTLDKEKKKIEIYQSYNTKDFDNYISRDSLDSSMEKITINGLPAIKTTSDEGYISILVKDPNKNMVYSINFALDFISFPGTAYEIYSTFKFTDSTAALSPVPTEAMVACTMEAKLCPDGITSVGRSGPKCEFEKCPGN